MVVNKIFYNILISIISIGLFSSCSYDNNQLPQKHSKSIIVKGNSTINVKADTTILELDVNTIVKNIIDIQPKNNKIINNIVDALVKLGIDKKDIYTYSLTIFENYNDKSKDLYKISDYDIYTTISIRVKDIKKINEILTEARNKAKKFDAEILDVTKKLTVSDYDKYYKEALKKAIEDGNNKAKDLAKSLGVDLGTAVKITFEY